MEVFFNSPAENLCVFFSFFCSISSVFSNTSLFISHYQQPDIQLCIKNRTSNRIKLSYSKNTTFF